LSQLESRFTSANFRHETFLLQHQLHSLPPGSGGTDRTPSSPWSNRLPWDAHNSLKHVGSRREPSKRPTEPTHFHWNTMSRRKKLNRTPSNAVPSDNTGHYPRNVTIISHYIVKTYQIFLKVLNIIDVNVNARYCFILTFQIL